MHYTNHCYTFYCCGIIWFWWNLQSLQYRNHVRIIETTSGICVFLEGSKVPRCSFGPKMTPRQLKVLGLMKGFERQTFQENYSQMSNARQGKAIKAESLKDIRNLYVFDEIKPVSVIICRLKLRVKLVSRTPCSACIQS